MQETVFRGSEQHLSGGLRDRLSHLPAPKPAAAEAVPPRADVFGQSTAARTGTDVPGSVEETGLDLAFISDLVLKVIYFHDQVSGGGISDLVCLRYGNVVERALTLLRREHLIETLSKGSQVELNYGYTITDKGIDRVLKVLERNAYVGPAPVTVEHYVTVVKRQAISETRVSPEAVRTAMATLVLEEQVVHAMGRAVNTGRSLLLYGPPGNGKTVLAEHIIPLLGGHVYIPHAIIVDGQIIRVYDPPNHQPIAPNGATAPYDQRFILCKRPAIVVGGELVMETLELVFDPTTKIYQAPLQVKANGGMFLIDDFGRQLVKPQELLNRWIVPLEKRVDYLTLRTGKKIKVPFDQLIVFSTNLAPTDLVDEAFLRRIQNKIRVGNPTLATFCEIFRRQSAELGVAFDPDGLDYLLQEHYAKPGREFRACQPRDILRTLVGMARYDGTPPTLTPALIDQACETYFVSL